LASEGEELARKEQVRESCDPVRESCGHSGFQGRTGWASRVRWQRYLDAVAERTAEDRLVAGRASEEAREDQGDCRDQVMQDEA
jgi:hypothetical protein